jgi:UV DNA damage endonuclease
MDSPIKFRTATHKYSSSLGETERTRYLSEIVLWNAGALVDAVSRCAEMGIGAFRITSQILPLATHPVSGYTVDDLPDADAIHQKFSDAKEAARVRDIRLSFHPDQFVVLNSESERVVKASVNEMNHQARVARLTGAEALTLHAGGRTGGPEAALERLRAGVEMLGRDARALLALENDDRLFPPAELLPFCESMGIPFIYDVHHHRCRPDDMSVAEASARSASTWRDREPWMHLSSPKNGWDAVNPRLHADYIDPDDVPKEWSGHRMTIDVEAKEKERAVLAISSAMRERWAQ